MRSLPDLDLLTVGVETPLLEMTHAYSGFSLSIDSVLEVYRDNYIRLASAEALEALETEYWRKETERVDAKEELRIMLDQLMANQQDNRRFLGEIGPSDPLYTDIL
ncbi:hypothetical protein NL676_030472 [Syzygium grande]|nr:hypothetical protein NL676_030472 [Syzygium grande]